MWKTIFACTAFTVCSSAVAQAADTMVLATELGNVLASEKFCNLHYDQAAIEAFIESQVPDNDMSFNSYLTTMIQGAEFQMRSMSASQKTAHCAQTRRVAKSYGFLHSKETGKQ